MKMAFVCNGSSIRAQLAAAIAGDFFKDAEIVAAGSVAEEVDPLVVQVLEEDEISTENLDLKTLFDLDFDLDHALIVGCDEGGCPLVFAKKVAEWEITNPKGQEIEAYRIARNELKEEMKKLFLEVSETV